MMNKPAAFLLVPVLGLSLTTLPSRADIPDSNPSAFSLDRGWPDGGLDVQHPPFVYDYAPDHPVSKASFSLLSCLDSDCGFASGFFIETERDDNLVCAMTAGHVVDELFRRYGDAASSEVESSEVESSEVESSEVASSEAQSSRVTGRVLPPRFDGLPLPGDITMSLNYRRLNAREQKVSFYGNRMPANAIRVVRSILGPQATPGDIRQDLALLLVDTSGLKGKATISALPYVFFAEGAEPDGRLVVKGHPNSWPLHRSDIHATIAHPGHFNLSAVANGAMSGGASGGPWAYDEQQGTAFAVHACGATCTDPHGQHVDGISGAFLTPLREEIEATCKQSKKKKYVFLTSVVKPLTAFLKGFVPPGKNRDILAHLSGASCLGPMVDTAFISTTSSQSVAYERATAYANAFPGEEVYLYKIRADEKFYNANISLQDSLKHLGNVSAPALTLSKAALESEYLFVDDVTAQGIPPSHIVSAQLFKKEQDGRFRHQSIGNVNFVPAETTVSSFSYVGPASSSGKMNLTWMSKVGNAPPRGSCLMPDSVPEDNRHFPAELLLNLNILKEL